MTSTSSSSSGDFGGAGGTHLPSSSSSSSSGLGGAGGVGVAGAGVAGAVPEPVRGDDAILVGYAEVRRWTSIGEEVLIPPGYLIVGETYLLPGRRKHTSRRTSEPLNLPLRNYPRNVKP